MIGTLEAFAESEFGEPDNAIAIARKKLGRSSDPRDTSNLAWFELIAKNYETSLKLYLSLFETDAVPDEWQVTTTNVWSGPEIAYLLIQMGDKERAESLIQEVVAFQAARIRNGDKTTEPIEELAWSWLSVGDSDNGLKYLRQLVDMGWDMGLSTESDPTLDFIRDDSEFQTILKNMREIRAEQIRSLAADGLISAELASSL